MSAPIIFARSSVHNINWVKRLLNQNVFCLNNCPQWFNKTLLHFTSTVSLSANAKWIVAEEKNPIIFLIFCNNSPNASLNAFFIRLSWNRIRILTSYSWKLSHQLNRCLCYNNIFKWKGAATKNTNISNYCAYCTPWSFYCVLDLFLSITVQKRKKQNGTTTNTKSIQINKFTAHSSESLVMTWGPHRIEC